MNKIYKHVWSKVRNTWVVASEIAKGHGKSSSSEGNGKLLKSLVLTALLGSFMTAGIVPVAATLTPEQQAVYDAVLQELERGKKTVHYFSVNSVEPADPAGTNWNNDGATGKEAVAIGSQAQAQGEASTALGYGAKAQGISSTALGREANAQSDYSTAIGNAAQAQGGASIALGYGAVAQGNDSTALGYSSVAQGIYSTALGSKAKAYGQTSTAVGRDAVAQGKASTALGSAAKAEKDSSTALGSAANAKGDSSTALGGAANAKGDSSTALGYASAALGSHSMALGYASAAQGDSSLALGNYAKAEKNYSTALGDGANAQSDYSTAVGYTAKALGAHSTALGDLSVARGTYSMALGREAQAEGNDSAALGYLSKAQGTASMALGREAQALVDGSVALGNDAVASREAGTVGYSASAGGTTLDDVLTALNKKADYDKWTATINASSAEYERLKKAYFGASESEQSAAKAALDEWKGKHKDFFDALEAKGKLEATWRATKAAVSVGGESVDKAGNKIITSRQITNVAAGTQDTDAVNVAQLKALNTKVDKGAVHYFSVNSIEPADPAGTNWNNDGAIGGDAVAIGNEAVARGDVSTALGYKAVAQGLASTAIGVGAKADGESSTALGNKAKAQSDYSTALGYLSAAQGHVSTALGYGANAKGDVSTAIGYGVQAEGRNSIAIGIVAQAKGLDSTALGGGAKAQSDYSTALGSEAKAAADNSVAIGRESEALVDGSVALGSDAVAGRKAGTVGYSASAGGTTLDDVLTALNKKTDYDNWTATINASKAEYERLTDAYFNATSTDEQEAAKAALDTWKKQHKDFVDALEAKIRLETTWKANKGAVSVGREVVNETGNLIVESRQITNVAAGTLDTDAVNVAQLKGVNTKVDKNTENITKNTTNITNLTTKVDTNTTNITKNTTDITNLTTNVTKLTTKVGKGSVHFFSVNSGEPADPAGTNWNNDGATGKDAVAIGSQAKAQSDYSTAIGNLAIAKDPTSTALGYAAKAYKLLSTAVGGRAEAQGAYSTALGFRAIAQEGSSTALGHGANAYGPGSTALGHGARAQGTASTALGSAEAQGDISTALGCAAKAYGDFSTALGNVAIAKGNFSTALGREAEAQGSSSVALGYRAIAQKESSTALGREAEVAADNGVAIGTRSEALVNGSIALGEGTVAGREAGTVGYLASAGGTTLDDVLTALNKKADYDKWTATINASKAEYERLTNAYFDASESDKPAAKAALDTWKGQHKDFVKALEAKGKLEATWRATKAAVSVGRDSLDEAGNKIITSRQITNVAAGTEDTDAVNVAQLKALNTKVDKGAVHYFSVNSDEPANPAGTNWNNDGAKGEKSVAIGPGSTTKFRNGLSVGTNNLNEGYETTVVGSLNKAYGMGDFKYASGATIVGTGNTIMSNKGTLAMGSENIVHEGIAIGTGNNSMGENAVALGNFSSAMYTDSIGIGFGTHGDADAVIAIGRAAKGDALGGVAIGRYAEVHASTGVALGESSVSSRGAGVVGYMPGAVGQTAEEVAAYLGKADEYKSWKEDRKANQGAYDRAKAWHAAVDAERQAHNELNQARIAYAKAQTAENKKALTEKQEAWQKAADKRQETDVAMRPDFKTINDLNARYGQIFGKLMSTEGAVSVGDEKTGRTRQIINVAAGTKDTDAVNVYQLKALATAPMNFYFGGTKDKTTKVYTPGTTNWSTPLNEFRMDFGDGLKAEQVTDKDGKKYTLVTLDKDSLKNDPNFKGPQGDKGDPGAKGDKGDPGAKGDKGDPGAKGDKGDPGVKGDPGTPGAPGEKGDKGDPGAKGDKGDPGTPGAPGEKGDKGDPGAKGDKGDPGTPGEKGDKGDPGAKGDKGDPGAPGTPGEKGEKGDPGTPGAPGEKGEKGDPGTPGEKGEKGDPGTPGEKGEKGDPGAPGEKGDPGKSAYEIWKEKPGNGGKTEDDFLNSLKGKDGKNGTGADIDIKDDTESGVSVTSNTGASKKTYTIGLGKKIKAGEVTIDGTKDKENAVVGDVKINGEKGKGTITGLSNTTWDENNVVSGRAATEDQLNQATRNMQNHIYEIGKHMNGIAASNAALAGLHPLEYDENDKWNLSAAIGNYKGANAFALGAFYRPNERTLLSVGGTLAGEEHLLNVGLSLKTGPGTNGKVYASRAAMAREIQKLKEKEAARDVIVKKLIEQDAKKEAEITELKLLIKELKNKIK